MHSLLRTWFGVRSTRRCPTASKIPPVESLEPRQLLAAADLTLADEALVSIEPAGVNVHIDSTVRVVNSGTAALFANDVELSAVLSVDSIFGNGDDVELDLDLLDLNLPAGTVANGHLTGTVNQEHYLAAHFLLIKIDPADEVGEVSENNNTAVLALPHLPTLTASPGQTVGKTNRMLRVDPGMTFTDSPSQSFDGGQLRVSIADDLGDHNILSIKRIKTDAGILRRRQNELRLGDEVIGTISGGTNTQPLVISFTGNVHASQIEQTASAVSLKGKKGVTGVRDVEFYIVEPTIVIGFTTTRQVILI